MEACRVIFRMDYKVSWAAIDSPGTILEILDSIPVGNSSGGLQEDQTQRLLQAVYISNNREQARQIQVAPTHIVLDFESADGVQLTRLLSHPELRPLLSCVNDLRDHLKLQLYTRIGIRFFLFEDAPRPLEDFLGASDRRVTDPISSILGGISDVGLAFDGQHQDGIHYHLKFGPHLPTDAANFTHVRDRFIARRREALFFDFDFYESNIKLTPRIEKWIEPFVERAIHAVREISAIFRREDL